MYKIRKNDNYYFTSKSVYGPWRNKGLFCPEGTLTHNSQCSFIFCDDNQNVPMYIEDRWSFPRQASSATLVMLPVQVSNEEISIPKYMECWSLDDLLEIKFSNKFDIKFKSNIKDESYTIKFSGKKVFLFGISDCEGGYAKIEVIDSEEKCIHTSVVDFYSLVSNDGLRYMSSELKDGEYKLKITVMDEQENGLIKVVHALEAKIHIYH